ncbi:MAG: hypothetical protein JWO31_2872, partial [Phycisphaerales bacterium]|nr:hypothetical protein [Phycisphaerales bacterium]
MSSINAGWDSNALSHLGDGDLPVQEDPGAIRSEDCDVAGEGGGGGALSRALDAFLQPRNIKWLLVVGLFILLASSLMLVGAHWHGSAPAWKYLVLLGYTAGAWAVGRWCHAKLGLPRTGTVVTALAVLLLPVTFLGLGLVGRTGPP